MVPRYLNDWRGWLIHFFCLLGHMVSNKLYGLRAGAFSMPDIYICEAKIQ